VEGITVGLELDRPLMGAGRGGGGGRRLEAGGQSICNSITSAWGPLY
jgi:hypothetical protein